MKVMSCTPAGSAARPAGASGADGVSANVLLPGLVAALKFKFALHEAPNFAGVLYVAAGLIAQNEGLLAPFYDAGGVDAVVAGVRKYATSALVQSNGLKLLVFLFREAQLDAGRLDRLRASNILDVVNASMRLFLADETIQHAGCAALTVLHEALNAPGWPKTRHNLDNIFNAMRAHPASPGVQLYGCRALSAALHHASYANRDRAIAVDALAIVTAAWRTLGSDIFVAVDCLLTVLILLLIKWCCLEDFIDAGVPEMSVDALRAHPALHDNVYKLLCTMLVMEGVPNETLAKRLLASGALELAKRAGGTPNGGPRYHVAMMLQDYAERAAERAAAELLAEEDALAAAADKKKTRRSKKKASRSAVIVNAAEAPAAPATGAEVLGEIFPWLLVDPTPSPVAAPVLPPLPLAAQAVLAQQQQATPSPEHKAALAEVARLRAEVDANLCPVCLDAVKCTVLLPCRHLALCAAPACRAMLGAQPLCPLCRCGVEDTMHLFV